MQFFRFFAPGSDRLACLAGAPAKKKKRGCLGKTFEKIGKFSSLGGIQQARKTNKLGTPAKNSGEP